MHRVRRSRADLRPAPQLRARAAKWVPPPPSRSPLLPDGRFRFLSVERRVATAADWNNPDWDRLWLYNLHYHDVLNGDGASTHRPAARALVARWIAQNPPCSEPGWEPYPTSLRIVNWIKWALAGEDLTPDALHSLAVQTRHLSSRIEWHLLGNHLLENAKALTFSGSFFSGPEADEWLKKGLTILEREIAEQVLEDGGHFERSPMYHGIILGDLLDVLNVMAVYSGSAGGREHTLRRDWSATAARMIEWLRAMCHPDGDIAFFNDAAFGVAPDAQALERYASDLAVRASPPSTRELQYLSDSGYVSARIGAFALLFDAAPIGAPYLPGHAHADTLCFELSWRGRRVICNSGTSCYGTGDMRAWERSTAAHNTVTVDAQNSSEVWHGFRVARRAVPFDCSVRSAGGAAELECAHDGYTRLHGRPIHRRRITIREGEVSWHDEVSGRGSHLVTGNIPLHPDMQVRARGAGTVQLVCPGGGTLELAANGGLQLHVGSGTYAPEFGKVLERPVVSWTIEGPLPLHADLRLRPV